MAIVLLYDLLPLCPRFSLANLYQRLPVSYRILSYETSDTWGWEGFETSDTFTFLCWDSCVGTIDIKHPLSTTTPF